MLKRIFKSIVWTVGCLVLVYGCLVAFVLIRDQFKHEFEETTIDPDESRVAPKDTIINANGVEFKMIGVRGGEIDCKGLMETVELEDFYIGETEVTQELWTAIMGDNPSLNQAEASLPVENVSLDDCLKFINKLDSVTGMDFKVPTYPQWLYVGYLARQLPVNEKVLDAFAWHKDNSGNVTHSVKQKKPNSLGVYDLLGNVNEWTISGPNPLYIVAGGSYETEKEKCNDEFREFDHYNVKTGSLGLRLVMSPDKPKKKIL